MDELLDKIEIQSRLKYLTDPKAKAFWEFLNGYVQEIFDSDNCQSTIKFSYSYSRRIIKLLDFKYLLY